ncbi:hypothetical protein BGZ83_006821 [Gryganskiella cystojenkinii]|nr:hypothetical protein BGZ83_006821 [Gryganskiella cystojenkinii]
MPQFGVRFLHDLVPASTLDLKDDNKHTTTTIMTGPMGRRWVCTHPRPDLTTQQTPQDSISKKSKANLEQEDRENIRRGLALLEPLTEGCLHKYQCAHALTNQIDSVTEPSTCSYIMVISVPKLCTDPVFAVRATPEATNIECRRIATDQEIRQVEADAGDAHVIKAHASSDKIVDMEDQLGLLHSKELGRPKHFRDVLEGIRHYAQPWEPSLTETQQELLRRVHDHGDNAGGNGRGLDIMHGHLGGGRLRGRKPKEVIEQERQERLQVAQMFRDSFGEQPTRPRGFRMRFDSPSAFGHIQGDHHSSGSAGVTSGPGERDGSGGGGSGVGVHRTAAATGVVGGKASGTRRRIRDMDLEELLELLESTEEELAERHKRGESKDKMKRRPST